MAMTHVPEAALLDQHPSEAAYAALLEEISAVPEDKLVPINIDVLTAITTVLGALPEMRALRSEMEQSCGALTLRSSRSWRATRSRSITRHTRWRGASAPKAAVAELAAELNDVREQLLIDARALGARFLIDGERLKECKSVPGYRPIASDVLTIVTLIKERWSEIAGKTALTLPELNAYAARALELLAAVGLKDQAPAVASEAAVLRQKAFYLFVKAYASTTLPGCRSPIHFRRTGGERARGERLSCHDRP